MNVWVNTYHPLASSPDGPWTTCDPPLPPFLDASCRREPDLEAEFPTITGLCRPPTVRQLHAGDLVLYFTVKADYQGMPAHRRLTAVLRVIAERTSHAAAGDWYRERGLALPRNLLLPSNPPLPLEMTEGFYRRKRKVAGRTVEEIVRPRGPDDHDRIAAEWDKLYAERKARCQDVRICEALFRDLWVGKVLDRATEVAAFGGGFPNTRDKPQKLSLETLARVLSCLELTDVLGEAGDAARSF